MKIQAISPVMSNMASQPIRPVSFAGRKAPEIYLKEQTFNDPDDFSSVTSKDTAEQQLDIACRIAAYYKTKYEQLLENGSCMA
ncbi:hypothetical protein IJ182_09790 [bacterium]|nr:hypothetical protein [bacterium]